MREEDRSGLRYGGSDEGGFDEFDESDPSRRSNSAIRATCAASCADGASICPVNASMCTPYILITSRQLGVHRRSPAFASCNAAINSASDDLRAGHPTMITDPGQRSSRHAHHRHDHLDRPSRESPK